jgi:hypothetical protein
MENQIPQGTIVQVGGKDATVVEHGDGVVHLDIEGELVSVHPSQIVVVAALPSAADLDAAEKTASAPVEEKNQSAISGKP